MKLISLLSPNLGMRKLGLGNLLEQVRDRGRDCTQAVWLQSSVLKRYTMCLLEGTVSQVAIHGFLMVPSPAHP